ncbi:hypothetical protein T439DRAFT_369317 [Meredithblackwellia eburnea MCA 4105]
MPSQYDRKKKVCPNGGLTFPHLKRLNEHLSNILPCGVRRCAGLELNRVVALSWLTHLMTHASPSVDARPRSQTTGRHHVLGDSLHVTSENLPSLQQVGSYTSSGNEDDLITTDPRNVEPVLTGGCWFPNTSKHSNDSPNSAKPCSGVAITPDSQTMCDNCYTWSKGIQNPLVHGTNESGMQELGVAKHRGAAGRSMRERCTPVARALVPKDN